MTTAETIVSRYTGQALCFGDAVRDASREGGTWDAVNGTFISYCTFPDGSTLSLCAGWERDWIDVCEPLGH